MPNSVAAKGSPSVSSDSLDGVECNIIERKPSVDGQSSKKNLFDDDDDDESSGSDEDSEDGGAKLGDGSAAFKINEEYARRFEHNKKREELQKLEEKHGRALAYGKDAEDDSDSSEGETEDEEGFLVTDDLDAEISATLQAIKNKDPRIYDSKTTFYRPIEESTAAVSKAAKEKPVFLQDYHRERYMKGDVGADFDDDADTQPPPQTYAEEQDEIKRSILNEINALAQGDSGDDSDGDAFIKRKTNQPEEAPDANGVHPSRASRIQITEVDVANADKDPELFLSNFMASRAWAPAEGSKWEAFESDEEDKDNANFAEEFENAYNLRFEDPEKSNEVLKSYSRTLVAEKSVRREEKKGRKRQRELEKERKEAEKQERREERARLRRLKIEEAQEKLKKIKKAAGLHGKELKEEEWTRLLDGAWDDNEWEEEMRKQFGEDYYADEDVGDDSSDGEAGGSSKKRRPKKPKWDDDIDIKDIVPDFDDSIPPSITLTDDDEGEGAAVNGHEAADLSDEDEDNDDENPSKKRKTSKDHKKDRLAAKREARRERARIEALVDQHLELEDPSALASSYKTNKGLTGGFRYRETSPNSFGLTAHDILLAPSDAALNEFAGLKKLATFRDPEKKRKDKKRLGKKARLRQWRRENFGREYEHSGPTYGFERLATATADGDDVGAAEQGRRHVKGKGKAKGKDEEAAAATAEDGEKSRKRKRSRGTKASS